MCIIISGSQKIGEYRLSTVGTGGAQPTELQSTSNLSKYFRNKYGYLMTENIGQASINAHFMTRRAVN